jgi:tRNA (guanine-N7-)-methyltransferase
MVQDVPLLRTVRSYVVRAGRTTAAQVKALTDFQSMFRFNAEGLQGVNDLFDLTGPLHLEIGFGNSENLIHMAACHPSINYLGCEMHPPGLARALLAIDELSLSNVRVAGIDAIDVLAAIPNNVLDAVYIYFPDPWPKKRHNKRRLVNENFLNLLYPRLKKSGTFRFASDNEAYAEMVRDLISKSAVWANIAGERKWSPRPNDRVLTRFEKRAGALKNKIFEITASPRR